MELAGSQVRHQWGHHQPRLTFHANVCNITTRQHFRAVKLIAPSSSFQTATKGDLFPWIWQSARGRRKIFSVSHAHTGAFKIGSLGSLYFSPRPHPEAVSPSSTRFVSHYSPSVLSLHPPFSLLWNSIWNRSGMDRVRSNAGIRNLRLEEEPAAVGEKERNLI